MTRQRVLDNFLIDIRLSRRIDRHIIRVSTTHLSFKLSDRVFHLLEKLKFHSSLSSKIDLELTKQTKLNLHLSLYEDLRSQTLYNRRDAAENLKQSLFHLKMISELVHLLEPPPFIFEHLDKSYHLRECKICQGNAIEDNVIFNNLTALDSKIDFEKQYNEILANVKLNISLK